MKTVIKNFVLSVGIFSLGFIQPTILSASEMPTITTLSEIKKIHSINVSGNVEVFIVQSPVEQVKVHDNYYTKNALVQQKNGELRISSYQQKPLVVVVYVRELNTIQATDQAIVRTSGTLSVLNLTVQLKNNALAFLNTQTIQLSTDLKDQSKLSLTGNTADYYGTLSRSAKVDLNRFYADHSILTAENKPAIVGISTNEIEQAFFK